MKFTVTALLLLAAGCGPRVQVVTTDSKPDVGVVTALRHTVYARKLGCSAVDVGHGMVLTAAHCVDQFTRGDDTDVGMVIYQSTERDFAVLFDTERLDSPKACLRAPKLAERVYAVGYPVQLATKTQELTVTDGIVAGPDDGDGHLRITAPVYFGNSGGGAWSTDGCLIGLTVSGFLEMPGMNFIVSSADMTPWIPRG